MYSVHKERLKRRAHKCNKILFQKGRTICPIFEVNLHFTEVTTNFAALNQVHDIRTFGHNEKVYMRIS